MYKCKFECGTGNGTVFRLFTFLSLQEQAGSRSATVHADPDPGGLFNADLCGSGSETLLCHEIKRNKT